MWLLENDGSYSTGRALASGFSVLLGVRFQLDNGARAGGIRPTALAVKTVGLSWPVISVRDPLFKMPLRNLVTRQLPGPPELQMPKDVDKAARIYLPEAQSLR